MARKHKTDSVGVKGFFRLKIVEDGPDGRPLIVGDSGWCENLVTNDGFAKSVAACFAAVAGSSQVSHAALGTGTAPAVTDVLLDGEITDVAGARCATTGSIVASKTAQFVFTLASGVYTTTKTIQNVGLFQTSTTNAGTLIAGNTYATSQLASTQSVNGTYQIRFATA